MSFSTIFFNIAHSDDCRIMNFNPHTKDKVLVNHMIRSMNLRNKDMCEIRCYQEPNCVSYNYGPMQTGTPRCELNNRTYLQVSSDDFITREGYTYRDVLVKKNILILRSPGHKKY